MSYLVIIFAIIGAIFLLLAITSLLIRLIIRHNRKRIPKKVILQFNFDSGLEEYQPEQGISGLVFGKVSLIRTFVDTLEYAASDKRVRGLIAKTSVTPATMGEIQEIRNAVIKFRKSGKPVYAFAESFGEFSPGNMAYYLATAFDYIFVQPSGELNLTGLISQPRFLKGALAKLGIIPQMDSRSEYKSFLNMFTQDKFTDAHREANFSIIQSLTDQICEGVSESRKMSKERVLQLINKGPFSPGQAINEKLIDGAAYRDEVYKEVKAATDPKVKFQNLISYSSRYKRKRTKGVAIALIYGVGNIVRGETRSDLLNGTMLMGSETIARAFRSAVEDSDIKAIVFRINSPGGSYTASDTIWRETVRAKNSGKPVVVSMGGVAGSGGYFVAMAANHIVAQPGTLTGSIGVVGGKLVTGEFWKKLGVTFDNVKIGENASMWSPESSFTPSQWEYLEQHLDNIYKDFVEKVSQGRNIPYEKVAKVSRGRVWTGHDALRWGLIDSLGGLPESIKIAKDLAKIPEKMSVAIKVFPKKKSLMERIAGRNDIEREEL